MTTVPATATATTTELGYLAEAITDHYRRNPTPAGAALDLAVVLASVLPPADLNRVTDALDAHALIASAAAELEAAIAGERGPSADLVINDEEYDDDVAYVAQGGRYRVTFDPGPRGEARIGRTYNVPPVEVVIVDNDLAVLAVAIHRAARPLLTSPHIDVHVNPGPTPNTGRVVILAGLHNAGTGTYQRIGDQ